MQFKNVQNSEDKNWTLATESMHIVHVAFTKFGQMRLKAILWKHPVLVFSYNWINRNKFEQ